MGVVGSLVSVEVRDLGGVALVTISNRRARIMKFEITGVVGEPAEVEVSGNEVHRGSYTPKGRVMIRSLGRDGTILYPYPEQKA